MSPLGRVGTADDVAWTILYLVSDAASFITGQTIRPNGGVSMPW
jgi:NAD(P)-dependent dehydrogenase (short-subunit alcohol dehydrogenase family)